MASSKVSNKVAATRPVTNALAFLRSSASGRGSLWTRLFAPVDIASLVFFRIAFGAIMLWEVYRYYENDWIRTWWIDPVFHFTYYGFGWVQPWPGTGMYLHFLALGTLAIFVMLGLWYRVSVALFFVGFTYVFLLEQAQYLNHFYLICLISLVLIFIPAHRAFSVDTLRRPALRSDTVPAWALWLLVAQVGIVYFYGGLAKLNGDWLRGEPMRMWLADATDFPIIGVFFTEAWAPYLFSYGGLLLDLLVVPFLLWRRTRPFAFAAVVGFHLMNVHLFQIGIFPWFMIAATTLFFRPDWPRRLLGLKRPPSPRPDRGGSRQLRSSPGATPLQPRQYAIVALLGIYLTLQLVVPLRHHLYPGNVSWTEEGHRFSWHMKLRTKAAEEARFLVTDPSSDKTWEVDPEDPLIDDQATDASSKPDMILQFSHYLADEWRRAGYERVEVRADTMVSLNGREYQPIVDPTVDLAAQPRTLKSQPWVMPLEEPLPTQE